MQKSITSETKKPQWHIQTMEDQTGKRDEVQNEKQPVTSLCVVCITGTIHMEMIKLVLKKKGNMIF